MAGSTVLERTTEKDAVKTAQTQELSAAEKQHNERRAEILKLLYSDDEDSEARISSVSAPTAAVQTESAPTGATGAAQRLADYRAYAAPTSKHTLFDGIVYKDGELVSDVAVLPAPEVQSAPAAQAQTEVITAPAPVYAPNEEDALPTQRTMDTLRQSTAATAVSERTGLFAGISTRAKIVLAAIAFAIVMAVVVICVNTGIINRLDARIQTLREQVTEEQMKYEALEEEKGQFIDYEGAAKELIDRFAEEHGMTRG